MEFLGKLSIAIEYPPSPDGSVFGYAVDLLRAMRRVAPQHTFIHLRQSSHDPFRTDQRMKWELFDLPRALRRIQPDIYHAPYGAPPLPLLCNCPVVVTIHDFIVTRTRSQLRLPGKIYGRYIPWAVRRATHIITDSKFTAQEAINLARCRSDNITSVHLGVDHTVFKVLPANLLCATQARLGLPSQFIFFAGTLEPRKGTDVLLNTFARLIHAYPDLHLVLAGTGEWQTTPYYHLAHQLNIADRIKHLGFIGRNDLAAVFNLAKVFVFPSRLEGFGLPVLEAMACGTPVVASNVAALPEVAGDACIAVSSDDAESWAVAVAGLLGDRGLSARLGQKGLQRSAQFTWEKTARQTLAVYERVVRTHTK